VPRFIGRIPARVDLVGIRKPIHVDEIESFMKLREGLAFLRLTSGLFLDVLRVRIPEIDAAMALI
jgi:hypothetical protein